MNSPARHGPSTQASSPESQASLVMTTVVFKLAGTFGPKLSDDELKQKSADYIRLLARFSMGVLMEAYDDVVRDWTLVSWPPPGAFYTAAAKVTQRERERARRPELRPADLDAPRKSMKGVPLARVDAILDEHPTLSAQMRVWLRNLAISAGAGVEGEDRARQDAPPTPVRPMSPEEEEWKRSFEERKREMFPPLVIPGSKYVP